MASRAIGAGADVVRCLAGGIAAVVTTGANGGAREGAVIGLGAGPATGGLVATLASRCGREVTVVLAAGDRAIVAAGATCGHRHIGVELGRCPGRVTLVAGGAVGCGTDMGGALASGVAAVVTAGANGGARKGAVIRLRTSPNSGRFMAALAPG